MSSLKRTGLVSKTSEQYYFQRPTVAYNPDVFALLFEVLSYNDVKVLNALMRDAGQRHSEHNIARISREKIGLQVFGKESAKNHVSTSLKNLKRYGVIRRLEKDVYQINIKPCWSGTPQSCHRAEIGMDDKYSLPFELTLNAEGVSNNEES